MALYEFFDREDRHAGARPAGRWTPGGLVTAVRLALVGFLLTCWLAGAYAGTVYWSLQGSLLGVIASALISGAGFTFTWTLFTGLEGR
jgi:hypothetical protein